MGFHHSLIAAFILLTVAVPAAEEMKSPAKPIRVGVLTSAEKPGANTSQGLYIRILNDAGMVAGPVSGEKVRNGALDELDIFIIGGGSGTGFNKSLGPDGGAKVEEFVKAGGGVLGSCAGGYSFVRGGSNEILGYVEVANAVIIDNQNNRWARGVANVTLQPAGEGLSPREMFYANGPLWKVTDEPGFGRIEVLARFVTDVKKGKDPGGVMPGTPAILSGTLGDGRYVLFSAHPEFKWKQGNTPMIVDAARWVVRGKLAESEPISYEAVFPSMVQKKAE
jgi:hypothetical protein